MEDNALEAIATACTEAVSTVLTEYRPRLVAAALDRDHRTLNNPRHADNFLSRFDLELHDRYRALLTESLGELIYLSEEGEPEQIGYDPDLVVIVDPLDTSELAVRALNGYTHVLIYSRARQRPVAAAVGDFFHEIQLYTAAHTGSGQTTAAVQTRAGGHLPVAAASGDPSSRLLVTNYSMRPAERLLPLAGQHDLIRGLSRGIRTRGEAQPPIGNGPTGDHSRIGVDFGSIGLCHVATGATDAFIEFAKGFALWDLLPGKFILEAAGGAVCTLDGKPLPWPVETFANVATLRDALTSRQTFIAAGSAGVARAIAHLVK